MDPGNISPTEHLPWWLRETSKRILISLVGTGIWTRNSLNTSPVWWISIGAMLCAFKNLITDRTSQSAGAGIRAPSSTAATMLLWELGKGLLMHVLCDVITLSYTYCIRATRWRLDWISGAGGGDFMLHSDLKTAVRLPGSRARVRKSGTFCHCSVTSLLPLLLSPTAVWRLSYVFWAQRTTGLCADSTRCTQTRVHSARGKYIGWSESFSPSKILKYLVRNKK